MKISLTKKPKEVTIETIHEKPISVYKSWLYIVGIFLVIIVVSVIASAIVFYSLLSVDVFQNNTSTSDNSGQYPSIDQAKLKTAVDFINNRAVATGVISTSTLNSSISTTTKTQ